MKPSEPPCGSSLGFAVRCPRREGLGTLTKLWRRGLALPGYLRASSQKMKLEGSIDVVAALF